MKLRVNGKEVELAGPTPLLDYLAALGVSPRAVAVEINDRILDRAEFESAELREGDVVEVVRMVGGG
ncbi:MAG TPA: sulfur carrier protein ThiS [Candidatus Dormibacteraeota bacterium]